MALLELGGLNIVERGLLRRGEVVEELPRRLDLDAALGRHRSGILLDDLHASIVCCTAVVVAIASADRRIALSTEPGGTRGDPNAHSTWYRFPAVPKVHGTLRYRAPSRTEGKGIDVSSDTFSR